MCAADDDQAVEEPRGAAARLEALLADGIGGRPVEVVRLERLFLALPGPAW